MIWVYSGTDLVRIVGRGEGHCGNHVIWLVASKLQFVFRNHKNRARTVSDMIDDHFSRFKQFPAKEDIPRIQHNCFCMTSAVKRRS